MHSFDRILDLRWAGNPVRAWLVALGVAIVAYLGLVLLRRLVTGHIRRLAERTENAFDDVLVDVVAHTRHFFLLAVAAWIALKGLVFTARVEDRIDQLGHLLLLLQLGLWLDELISSSIGRFIEKRRAAGEPGAVATMRAVGFLGRGLLWVAIFLAVLDAFGVKVTALITGLGIGGIAVALAVQNILGDLFGALAIVLDKPFVVDDFIVVDQYMGTVEHIGLKTTRLRSLSGEQIIIANSELLKSRIRNYKRMYERRVVFGLGVVFDTPADVVARIPGMLREIVQAQPHVRLDRAHFATVGESALQFEVVYYVTSPDYNLYMDIQQAINLEVLRRFAAEGIGLAFPTRTVVLQQGDAREPAGGERVTVARE